MFKEIFHIDSVALLSEAALVIFVLVFIATALWIVTRSKASVSRWARLPLEDEAIAVPVQTTQVNDRKGARR